ncbi:anti-phage protein KwaB [Segatella oris]|uniref:anti-phage protein KwaB n=1 Tax=Segatella oris TaxID=28135 RepID=UPI0028EAE8BD|nr:anti-phage protein KwaB [Segatella oris]
MNKQELNEALAFINAPEGELQIIIYANISGANEPRRLDIKEEDLTELRKLFVASIESSIISKEDHTVLPLSSADERGNCFYQYDLEVPEGLKRLETIIGNDNLSNFSLSDNQFSNIESLIIVLADTKNEISLFKKLSTVEVIGRGGFMLWKSNQRFERFKDQLLRISSSFQALRVDGEIIIIDLDAIEKEFGFHEVIIKEATKSLSVIEEKELVDNIDTLKELVSDVRFARKLTKVARNSPVIRLGIPNESIIAFAKNHPLTKKKMKYNDSQTKFHLDTKVSKNLLIKILNDDLLTSELTKLYYDSLAKDDIIVEEE